MVFNIEDCSHTCRIRGRGRAACGNVARLACVGVTRTVLEVLLAWSTGSRWGSEVGVVGGSVVRVTHNGSAV